MQRLKTACVCVFDVASLNVICQGAAERWLSQQDALGTGKHSSLLQKAESRNKTYVLRKGFPRLCER